MTVIASEKTPLLIRSLKDEVVLKIPDDYDENNNNTSITTSLTYEELLPYIVDPYWIRVRKIAFSLTCTAFFVILLAACISSFTASTQCRSVSSMMHTSFSDDNSLNVMNQTEDEIPNGIVTMFLNGADIGIISDSHF